MSKKSFPIYIDSRYRGLIDSVVAEAKRISPDSQHFAPKWSSRGRCECEISFEASSDDAIDLLSDIYIFGNSSIFEKSVMYEISKQIISALDLLTIR